MFIEIEKPKSRFFRGDSSDFDAAFNTALQQIGRWRAWLSQPANLGAFLEMIKTIRLPHIMRRNPSYPSSLPRPRQTRQFTLVTTNGAA